MEPSCQYCVSLPYDVLVRVKKFCEETKTRQRDFVVAAFEEHLVRLLGKGPDENEAGMMSDALLTMRRNNRWSETMAAEAKEKYPWLPLFQPGWRNCESAYPKWIWNERTRPTAEERAERDEKLRLAKLRWMME